MRTREIGAWKTVAAGALLAVTMAVWAEPPPDKTLPAVSTSYDYDTWIDANRLLMFVSNTGTFATQEDHTFGGWAGLYYPFTSIADIESDLNDNTVIWAAGPWFAGIDHDTRETLTVVSEYADEYYPGPMSVIESIAGDDTVWTFDPDAETDPNVRVFKLYRDSLADNPGGDYEDYMTYAVVQGAPVNDDGQPDMLGHQMLWTVYNDANPANKTLHSSGTAPLGIEIQQTVWAWYQPGDDTVIYNTELDVTQSGLTHVQVRAWAIDPSAITGDTYRVTFEEGVTYHGFDQATFGWHLDNLTTGQRVLAWQHPDEASDVVEGMVVQVGGYLSYFKSLEVIANADGPFIHPVSAALASAGFPTPGDEDPGFDQQVDRGKWAIHVADNGGTCGGGTYGSYAAFLDQVLKNRSCWAYLRYDYDLEMRFTGSIDNPGVAGSYARKDFYDTDSFWVPFELWSTGPSQEYWNHEQLVPIATDMGDDNVFGLESWGCPPVPTISGGLGEHSASDGNDDPYTDQFDWYTDRGTEKLRNMVLINVDAGDEPPFAQKCPEPGTVFRIKVRTYTVPPDTFTFVSRPPDIMMTTPNDLSIYMRYLIFNKGGRTLDSCFFGIWSDPDLGDANDDVMGCDTLSDIHFTYNCQDIDRTYGYAVPVVGFKVLHGPLVQSPGDSGYFDGSWISDYRNLGMTAFLWWGFDPWDYAEVYRCMNGVRYWGPLDNGTTYDYPGDPVTGEGDIGSCYGDVHALASCGPFDMAPGDSQHVLVKLAVGRGADRLSSITRLKEILNDMTPPDSTIVPPPPPPPPGDLPSTYRLSQNYPNPFNPRTSIDFDLPIAGRVRIEIYNILGQRIATLLDEVRPAGNHTVQWDGIDGSGRVVSSGLYFYRITAGHYDRSKKMVLLK